MKVLICNVGSTSLKFKLFEMPQEKVCCEAKIERIGSTTSAIFYYHNLTSRQEIKQQDMSIPSYQTGIDLFLKSAIGTQTGVIERMEEIDCIGFKTVIAKNFYGVHELTDEVMDGMRKYLFIAPVHNKAYITAIDQFRSILQGVPMIGVFETAYHETIPLERSIYAVPYEWYETYGIKKMGYHGASHSYVYSRAQKLGPSDKVISCHLGGSCSICAIENGKSVDSSFGFSLQTGVMHANRCGDIDPYMVPFLMNEGMAIEEILDGLSNKGGLLGLSGVSNDLREIEREAEQGNERAKLAIDAFVCAVVRFIGAFYMELGGMDQLVFTGGIGENSAMIRERICRSLRHVGLVLDEKRNKLVRDGEISCKDSAVRVYVIPANEELGIAIKTYDYLNNKI